MISPALHEDLRWRGQVQDVTDEAGFVRRLAAGPVRVYAGFDPTADSLTIGNLVPIMLLRRFQEAGHTPVVVMGGGTGLIGDPSGKSAERTLLSRDAVDANVAGQKRIFERLLRFDGPAGAKILDNAEWLTRLGYIEALRDIGKHFSVNVMIQRDSVRSRLTERDHGISYTEFSYMILQAYDFLELRRRHGVEAQVGGSDQWGNIVAGVDLVRRVTQEAVFGLTAPLGTKADGGKFGKTEAGAVWITPERTSPYAMHQFWLNTEDADVGRFLRIFTLLPREEIERLERTHGADPGARGAQRALARHVTALVHGEEEARKAEAAAGALFSGDVRGLDERTLSQAFEAAPTSEHPRGALAGAGADLVEVLTQTTLAKSKREAREFLAAGAVSVNGAPAGADRRLTADDLLHGRTILLRRGKKNWHVTRWV